MGAAKRGTLGTEEHEGPRRSGVGRGRGTLIAAFPVRRALPVPVAGEPLGRAWLEAKEIVDKRVSTEHASFSRPGGTLFVEDAGSKNGTWVNGSRLAKGERASLSDGDLVRVGRTLLVYRDDFEGSDEASPPVGKLVSPFGLRGVIKTLRAIAGGKPTNVLIEGETGTGKELVAFELARAAGRSSNYVVVNVAGVPAGVFESQLFGYVPGGFSGSGKGSPGVFVEHRGGAVCLDEVGELPLDLQPKLLRVLDNREVFPVGAVRSVKVDVLVISATNRLLEDAVEKGTFRRDLLARLSAARIELPPLRERAEDIWEIAASLASARQQEFDVEQVEVEAVERLLLHTWPTNVRGLATAVDRISMQEPPPGLRLEVVERVLGTRGGIQARQAITIEQVRAALARCGSEAAAAREMRITRARLRRLLARVEGDP